MVIKLLRPDFPNNFINRPLVIHLYGEITPIIVAPKLRYRDLPLLESSAFGRRRCQLLFGFQLRRCLSACPLSDTLIFIYDGGSLRILMNWFNLFGRDLFLCQIFFWEISKWRVRIFGCKLVVPRFIVLVGRFGQHTLQMIFHNNL